MSAEDPELILVVDPVAGSKARPWAVAHVWVDYRAGREAVDARLANRGRTLHPDPLTAPIFPEIAERAIARGVVALTAEEQEISAGVGPSGGTPARAGNIGSGSNALGSIDAGLIDVDRLRKPEASSKFAECPNRPAAANVQELASVASKLANLASHGVRTLQVGPALHDPPVGDSPNHNSGEFKPLLRCRIGARPMVAYHHFVVLGDEVLDAYA